MKKNAELIAIQAETGLFNGLMELAHLADAFDKVGLKKQADKLDKIIKTICAYDERVASSWTGYKPDSPNETRPEKTFTEYLQDVLIPQNKKAMTDGRNLDKFDDEDPILNSSLNSLISTVVSNLNANKQEYGDQYSERKIGEFSAILKDIDPRSKKKMKKPLSVKQKYSNLMKLIFDTVQKGEGSASELHPAKHDMSKSPRRKDDGSLMYEGDLPVQDVGRA